jgi:tRNA acetyltransferase TAN1
MHKERSAEKELIHFLETIADEVYPETIEAEVKREDGAEEDLDLEEMLKRELEGMGGDKKSKRFRGCGQLWRDSGATLPLLFEIHVN